MTQIDHHLKCSETARNESLEQFVERWPGHYLLVIIPGGDSDDWDMDFQTSVISIDKLRAGMRDEVYSEDDADDEIAPPGTYLYEVKKHTDNSWLDWIAIGRARNNDLVLRHQSVSKLQARIHSDKEDVADGNIDSTYWLTDMKSTAGTTVNSLPISPSKPHQLSPGNRIKLGQVDCIFFDSAGLYNHLRAR
jgi:hypothetical protein